MSQSPQTGQFNSYQVISEQGLFEGRASQSPQTGQFNSYKRVIETLEKLACKFVSIPSNGSIQFLQGYRLYTFPERPRLVSQSPQTGQFNSYEDIPFLSRAFSIPSLNPLKRVNSILTLTIGIF